MGRHEHHAHAPRTACVGVITVSDSRTAATDESGALIRSLCEAAGHTIGDYGILPDDPDQVRGLIHRMLSRKEISAILISGGTGISGRDRTYEAVAATLTQRIDGFGELFRALSYHEIGAAAMMSRAVAGLVQGRPVFSMPGSPEAVRLAMEKLILPELGHVIAEASKKS